MSLPEKYNNKIKMMCYQYTFDFYFKERYTGHFNMFMSELHSFMKKYDFNDISLIQSPIRAAGNRNKQLAMHFPFISDFSHLFNEVKNIFGVSDNENRALLIDIFTEMHDKLYGKKYNECKKLFLVEIESITQLIKTDIPH